MNTDKWIAVTELIASLSIVALLVLVYVSRGGEMSVFGFMDWILSGVSNFGRLK